jgi:hypothetical protein
MYPAGVSVRRNWGGEYENVAILVAIALNEDGYRKVTGAVHRSLSAITVSARVAQITPSFLRQARTYPVIIFMMAER